MRVQSEFHLRQYCVYSLEVLRKSLEVLQQTFYTVPIALRSQLLQLTLLQHSLPKEVVQGKACFSSGKVGYMQSYSCA